MTKVDIAILLNLTEFFFGEILQQYKKKGEGEGVGWGGGVVCVWSVQAYDKDKGFWRKYSLVSPLCEVMFI